MKATFEARLNIIEAGVVRSDQEYKQFAWGEIRSGNQDDPISLFVQNDLQIVAVGTPNQIMRLIGALADDGQDCLVSVY